MGTKGAEAAIIARERELLERWSEGDPGGYAAAMAADGTYFDDMGATERLRGGDAIREYAASLAGQIPAHDYEMVEPHVQLEGDVGILTFRYHPKAPDGTALTPWRATTVYRRDGDTWDMVHAHWSMQKKG